MKNLLLTSKKASNKIAKKKKKKLKNQITNLLKMAHN